MLNVIKVYEAKVYKSLSVFLHLFLFLLFQFNILREIVRFQNLFIFVQSIWYIQVRIVSKDRFSL